MVDQYDAVAILGLVLEVGGHHHGDTVLNDGVEALEQPDSPPLSGLLRSNVSPLLGHRALHEENERDQSKRENGEEPEVVEVGQRNRLLLAEVRQRLQGQLPRRGPVTRLLEEEGSALLKERVHRRVERVEKFAHTRRVELFASLLEGLGHRRADAAPLVAEQGEQADRRPAQMCGGCT